MDDHETDAASGEDPRESLKAYVRLAVEALRALGGEGRSSSEVSLPTICAFVDALLEQIAHAASGVSAEELAACVERHIATRLSLSGHVTLPPAERMRRFIDMHYAEPLTLDDIAHATGCARSHAAATFKHQIGETPHRYIARVRVRRAAELIAQGDKIEAVILAVGYRSKKNFYRQFKLETGLTPATYRGRLQARGSFFP